MLGRNVLKKIGLIVVFAIMLSACSANVQTKDDVSETYGPDVPMGRFVEEECAFPMDLFFEYPWDDDMLHLLNDGSLIILEGEDDECINYYMSKDHGNTWEHKSAQLGDIPEGYTYNAFFATVNNDGEILISGYLLDNNLTVKEIFTEGMMIHIESNSDEEITNLTSVAYNTGIEMVIRDGHAKLYSGIIDTNGDFNEFEIKLDGRVTQLENPPFEVVHNLLESGIWKGDYVYGFDSLNRNLVKVDLKTGQQTMVYDFYDYYTTNYYVMDNIIIALDNVGMFHWFDINTGEKIDIPKAVKDNIFFEINYEGSRKNVFAKGFNPNEILFTGADGIYRYNTENNLVEQVISGDFNSLSNPAYNVTNLLAVSEKEFYCLGEENGKYHLRRYVYDENVPTIPQKVLTVSGNENNFFLKQVIEMYKKENLDVYVQFLDQESGAEADIYFYEKYTDAPNDIVDHSMDLSKVVKNINNDEGLFEYIVNTISFNKEIHMIPVRASVWTFVGHRKYVKKTQNLDEILTTLMESKDKIILYGPTEENFQEKLLDVYEHTYISGNIVDEDKYLELLESMDKLKNCDSIRITGFLYPLYEDSYIDDYTSEVSKDIKNFVTRYDELTQKAVDWLEIDSFGDYLYLIIDDYHKPIHPNLYELEILKDTCTPNAFIAVHEDAETCAVDFVKFMLSKDAQSLCTGGLPINKAGFEMIREQYNADYSEEFNELYNILNNPGSIGYMDDYMKQKGF